MRTARNLVSALAGVTLTVGMVAGAASFATADPPSPRAGDDCAKEQTQLEKAEAKLADLQDVFSGAKQEAKQARKDLRKAEKDKEKSEAKADLAEAKAAKHEAKADKVAQVKRVEKKQAAYDECVGESEPTETPEPTETATASESAAA